MPAPSYFPSQTLSASPNASSTKPSNGQMAVCCSPQVRRSPMPCGRVRSTTLAKATTCIYSPVSDHPALAVCLFLTTLPTSGLGLGSILCRASTVTDAMVEASSLGLADSLNEDERDLELLYPRLTRIREISTFIAMRVIRKAQEEVRNSNFV